MVQGAASMDGGGGVNGGDGSCRVSPEAALSQALCSAGLEHLEDDLKIKARRRTPLLISGPVGAGKSHLARAVAGLSKGGPARVVQHGCGDFTEQTFAAALFGHADGAYTGANGERRGVLQAAHGGTLILDDIDYLDLGAQRRLLRVLDDGCYFRMGEYDVTRRVDTRIIATTNKDLDAHCARGLFLSDLLSRLRRLREDLPPLRERRGAAARLARAMLRDMFRGEAPERRPVFSESVYDAMQRLPLTHNFRDLQACVENVALFARPDRDGVVSLEAAQRAWPDLRERAEGAARGGGAAMLPEPADPAGMDDAAMLDCLRRTGWNISATARKFNCARGTVYARIRKHGWTRRR